MIRENAAPNIVVREAPPTPETMEPLIRLSADWAAEESCRGYRANTAADIEGSRIFLAKDCDKVVGYLFGRPAHAREASSVMPADTAYFEVEELYVAPPYRSRGIGKMLFRCAEAAVSDEAAYLLLSTATKNWRAVFHFYLDELEMEFWNARLFKRLGQT